MLDAATDQHPTGCITRCGHSRNGLTSASSQPGCMRPPVTTALGVMIVIIEWGACLRPRPPSASECLMRHPDSGERWCRLVGHRNACRRRARHRPPRSARSRHQTEDPDLWRFVDDAAAHLGVTPVVVTDGRMPWQVFADQRFLVLSPHRQLSEWSPRLVGSRLTYAGRGSPGSGSHRKGGAQARRPVGRTGGRIRLRPAVRTR
jgi:hypothetical protein